MATRDPPERSHKVRRRLKGVRAATPRLSAVISPARPLAARPHAAPATRGGSPGLVPEPLRVLVLTAKVWPLLPPGSASPPRSHRASTGGWGGQSQGREREGGVTELLLVPRSLRFIPGLLCATSCFGRRHTRRRPAHGSRVTSCPPPPASAASGLVPSPHPPLGREPPQHTHGPNTHSPNTAVLPRSPCAAPRSHSVVNSSHTCR